MASLTEITVPTDQLIRKIPRSEKRIENGKKKPLLAIKDKKGQVLAKSNEVNELAGYSLFLVLNSGFCGMV